MEVELAKRGSCFSWASTSSSKESTYLDGGLPIDRSGRHSFPVPWELPREPSVWETGIADNHFLDDVLFRGIIVKHCEVAKGCPEYMSWIVQVVEFFFLKYY